MAKLQRAKVEFGDFQTPQALASQVTRYLQACGEEPSAVLEPTCGTGSFMLATAKTFPMARLVGYDINPAHLRRAADSMAHVGEKRLDLREQSFFDLTWREVLRSLGPPVLVLGNPPWVTASELGGIGSTNLPEKSNFQKRNGLDAITGKANFDIAEYMLIRLAEALSATHGSLAMLVKTSVARRFLHHAWSNCLRVHQAQILRIDSEQHFGVNAEACLLYCKFSGRGRCDCCEIMDLDDPERRTGAIGWSGGRLCADIEGFAETVHLTCDGAVSTPLRWRSGVKHDCAGVMELQRVGSRLLNSAGQELQVEETHLYPLLKGSAVANGRIFESARVVLMPQRFVGEETDSLQLRAPATWGYLLANAAKLDARASSIYRKQPRFSVFGVGDYTFRPFKVAISALYKKLEFRVVRPIDGKPVLFDDTVNFLGFDDEPTAKLVKSMLDSQIAQRFYQSRIFWDSKRPITTQVLGELDLSKLAKQLDISAEFRAATHNEHARDADAAMLF